MTAASMYKKSTILKIHDAKLSLFRLSAISSELFLFADNIDQYDYIQSLMDRLKGGQLQK